MKREIKITHRNVDALEEQLIHLYEDLRRLSEDWQKKRSKENQASQPPIKAEDVKEFILNRQTCKEIGNLAWVRYQDKQKEIDELETALSEYYEKEVA